MATSGTYDFNLTVDEIIEEAYERITIPCVVGQARYELRAKDVDVMEVAVRTSGADMVISRVSRDQSMYIPNKEQQGRPTQFFFDRLVPPVIEVWPVPNTATQTLVLDVFTFTEDTGSYGNTMALPRRFLPAMVAGLTFHLAEKKAPQLVAEKKALYDQALIEALAADEEVGSFFVRPAAGNRRRR
jgi:hypothetical protein